MRCAYVLGAIALLLFLSMAGDADRESKIANYEGFVNWIVKNSNHDSSDVVAFRDMQIACVSEDRHDCVLARYLDNPSPATCKTLLANTLDALHDEYAVVMPAGSVFGTLPTNASVYVRRMKDGAHVYIQLRTVARGSDVALGKELEVLQSEGGYSEIVLDLRSNEGGDVETAIGVGDLFIADGPLVTLVKPRMRTSYSAKDDALLSEVVPVTVLVNEQTASVAELIVLMLREADRGKVYGSKTYGKGVFQLWDSVVGCDMWRVFISHGCFESRAGHCYHGAGVTPDVAVAPGLLTEEYLLGLSH